MNAPSFASIYNPRSQSDDNKFIAEFVARHGLLDALIRRLRVANSDDLRLHHILIGPRGMGKTSLLRRIAIEIDREPDLSAHLIPLSFREEQYNVLTLGDFWRNCGESLAEWAEATGKADLAGRLDKALSTKAWATDEEAAEQFHAEMTALARRAVLLVDNLDLILDALSPESNWALRRHFQSRRGPILIGASTHPLKQAADRDAAFYEFFEPAYLDPLNDRETEHCMRALARSGGEHGAHVIHILDTEPERLRTLHTLTGGNPRVLALIYRLLGTGESEAAMADLERLLDEVTPYYKAKVEEYQTAQQRAVIDAIALHWDPITTGDLATLTRITATTLSPLLIRLRKDGLLETVELSGSYAGHQLVERFLNIWYLMRHGTRRTKQKMRWLVAFLTSFYSLRELTEIAGHAPERAAWNREYQFAFNEAMERHRSRVKADEMRDLTMVNHEASGSLQITPFGAINDRLSDSLERNQQTSRSPIDLTQGQEASELSTPYQAVKAVLDNAANLFLAGDGAAATVLYDDVLARFADAPEPGLREQVARALNGKANILGQVGDRAAALATYDAVLARFADAPEPSLREQVANALYLKAITLGEVGDSAAALATYDDFLARFADAPEPSLREPVARALCLKAITLAQVGDTAAAIAIYDDVLARFADAPELVLRDLVAKSLYLKAITLDQVGDSAPALTTYDDFLARFADAPEPGLRELVAKALLNKAITVGQVGNRAAELATYDDVLARFADAPEPSLREQVAKSLVNKAITLGRAGDSAAALTNYDDVLARFADAPEPDLREQVARALNGKAYTLGQVGDHAAAVAIYDDVLVRFADAPESNLRELVAGALINKAITLGQVGDSAAELATYDEILARFANAPDPVLREQVSKALYLKAITPGQVGDSAAAISIYDDVLARFADAPEPGLHELVAMALVNRAITRGKAGDSAAAIATCDHVLARFADAPEPGLRKQVAKALCCKAMTLRDRGEITAAIDIFEQLLGRASDESDSSAATEFAIARVALADMLLDWRGDLIRPEMLYQEAAKTAPLSARANLAWFYLLADRPSDARRELRELNDLPSAGLALLNAGIDLASDNFGSATSHLTIALESDLNAGTMSFADDVERLLRLAHHKGYGEQLLAWFEQTGVADRLAPLYVAFKAYVGTEKLLLDVNPEVRRPAKTIYDRLDAPRRHAAASVPKNPKPSRRLRNATPRSGGG